MCQACLALASRRSKPADQDDGGGWLARPPPSRFAAVADWADEPPADAPADAPDLAAPQASGCG